jgi:hypothetical protein
MYNEERYFQMIAAWYSICSNRMMSPCGGVKYVYEVHRHEVTAQVHVNDSYSLEPCKLTILRAMCLKGAA